MAKLFDKGRPIQMAISLWEFGQPTLHTQGNGKANWERGENALSTHQKGGNGWVARLYGGLQSAWDDAAEVYIPVNEMPLTKLQVGTTMWSYFMEATELGGVGIVIWVHDPKDDDKRAEISMLTTTGHMEIGSGWNAHELADGNDCIWYGENTGTHDTTVTAGDPYDFSQFLADDVFSTYTIYRISFAYGYETGNSVYDPAYLADVKINGTVIPLGPIDGKHRKTVKATKALLATEKIAGDVFSESVSANGTAWSWSFGGTGYITKAIIDHNAAVTPRVRLHLWGFIITDTEAEMDDSDAFNGPVAAGLPYYIGYIDFPAMHYSGTGDAISIATPNTPACNLPLEFNTHVIYGVTETLDTFTPAAEDCNIHLTADMEDS